MDERRLVLPVLKLEAIMKSKFKIVLPSEKSNAGARASRVNF